MPDTDPSPAEATPAEAPATETPRERSWHQVATVPPAGTPLRARSELRQRDRRRSARIGSLLPASYSSIDPARDPRSGELVWQTADEEVAVNVSRRGLCMRCERPPEPGTRLLIQIRLPRAERPVELVARARWSRIEYVPGEHGARAVARVGLDVIGGAARALDDYESFVGRINGRHGRM